MLMSYYFAPTANILLVFEAVSLCPYVAVIPYVDVYVLLLDPDSKHPSRVQSRVPSDPTEGCRVRNVSACCVCVCVCVYLLNCT